MLSIIDSGRDSYVNSSRRLYEPRTDPNYATRVGLGDSRAGGMAGISADEMFGSTNSGGLPLNYTGSGGRSDTYSGSAGRNYRDLPLSYQATSSGATDSWATSGSSFIGSSRAYGDAGASTNSWSTAGGGALASGVHMLWNGSGRGSGIGMCCCYNSVRLGLAINSFDINYEEFVREGIGST